MTVKKAFVTQEGITAEGMATAEDYGDDLLHAGKIDRETYDAGQALAREILRGSFSHGSAPPGKCRKQCAAIWNGRMAIDTMSVGVLMVLRPYSW